MGIFERTAETSAVYALEHCSLRRHQASQKHKYKKNAEAKAVPSPILPKTKLSAVAEVKSEPTGIIWSPKSSQNLPALSGQPKFYS